METLRYGLDDLPRFSPWPARLLGIEPWGPVRRTAPETFREYENDKWGPLLARFLQDGGTASLAVVDRWALGEFRPCLSTIEDRWELLPALELHQRHLDLVSSVLAEFLPAAAIVELGCGYGSVLLALAKRPQFAGLEFIGGEFTASGVELLRRLSEVENTALTAGRCDFASVPMSDLSVPPGSVVFSSFATHNVPMLGGEFVDQLCGMRPSAVVHFEPCYEHCDDQTLLGMMRRRYIEMNDYNRNLITLLRDAERRGAVHIEMERRALLGMNPLLPASLVAWVPTEPASRGG